MFIASAKKATSIEKFSHKIYKGLVIDLLLILSICIEIFS